MTVDNARRILGNNCPMTDREITAMLEQFRRIAFVALDVAEADKARSSGAPRSSFS